MTEQDADASPSARRLFAPGKKRILALDGGGVRGIVTLAFLAEMERQLRQATGRKDLVLSDVFDLVAGTSVGSMLATMVSLGRETVDIEAAFRELAPKIFSGRTTIFGQRRFDARPLVNGVRAITKGETLGSDKLLTGLAIIAKRVDTGSVWVVSNNPRMPYFHDGRDWDGNKRYKLESLIRASTAAPFLFTPTEIVVHTERNGKERKGLFVDGGVSPHNNPSLLMLMMAALPSYKLGWRLGPSDLLMISVGTGQFRSVVDRSASVLPWYARTTLPTHIREDIEEAAFAAETLRGMISDAGMFVLKSMQAVSNPRFSWIINSEIGDLDGELLLSSVKGLAHPVMHNGLLSFQRYDLPLEPGYVNPDYDIGATKEERSALVAIDEAGNIDKLSVMAREAARKQVSIDDFDGFV